MDLNEAKSHRELLMKERAKFVDTNTKGIFERDFALCEH